MTSEPDTTLDQAALDQAFLLLEERLVLEAAGRALRDAVVRDLLPKGPARSPSRAEPLDKLIAGLGRLAPFGRAYVELARARMALASATVKAAAERAQTAAEGAPSRAGRPRGKAKVASTDNPDAKPAAAKGSRVAPPSQGGEAGQTGEAASRIDLGRMRLVDALALAAQPDQRGEEPRTPAAPASVPQLASPRWDRRRGLGPPQPRADLEVSEAEVEIVPLARESHKRHSDAEAAGAASPLSAPRVWPGKPDLSDAAPATAEAEAAVEIINTSSEQRQPAEPSSGTSAPAWRPRRFFKGLRGN